MKKIFKLIILIAIFIIPQLGCDSQTNNNAGVEKTSFHFDTVCKITIYSMNGIEDMNSEEQRQEALLLITDAFKLCDQYENILSSTREGTDIYKINQAGGQAVEVSDTTVDVLQKGIEYGRLSDGRFDITIGGVSMLWDFHGVDEQGNKVGTVPDGEALAEAASHVDYSTIEIKGNTVRLADGRAQIDLGGVAKGYIADKLAEYLESKGVTSGLISLGGNIVAIGEKGRSMSDGAGTPFAIGIGDPASDGGDLLGTVPCKDKTVVTSGTYQRYFEAGGKRYHHVLNPDTGYQYDTDLISVTVIGDRGRSADCDALSTICLALGKDKGMEFIKNQADVQAVFVDDKGEVSVWPEDLKLQ